MKNETDLEMLYRIRSREDGWTPQVMEMFIIQLIETGSVRKAAMKVDRHVTTVYRLRARDPAFAKAWDAARRMAYARLRDEAMERALYGTPQQVWKDGEWVGMKRVYSDRLLMNLLNHLKHEDPRGAMRPRDVEEVEDRRSDAVAGELDRLNAPRKPVRLRPAKLLLGFDSVNGVALV
jgi:hypothetical protein